MDSLAAAVRSGGAPAGAADATPSDAAALAQAVVAAEVPVKLLGATQQVRCAMRFAMAVEISLAPSCCVRAGAGSAALFWTIRAAAAGEME